ncbi:hypothetical protein MKZ38_001986 [Zalerion maritima]|uniref:Fungal-type protein kinase domain-containing protein n=1 Tax=Zalerion maritima TaxID=339359 RepID=A0AAD5RX34_9PEZI|nr:hypothetical protein MKZ38_001986 [Zalerion maritima]
MSDLTRPIDNTAEALMKRFQAMENFNVNMDLDPSNPKYAGLVFGQDKAEQHSFMHDLESFFWVLSWICLHYNGPAEEELAPLFR